VHDVEQVEVGQGLGHLLEDGARLLLGVPLLLQDGVEQLRAAGVLEHQHQCLLVLEDPFQPDDVRVLQPLHDLHLPIRCCSGLIY
jgi:hypothetical protein